MHVVTTIFDPRNCASGIVSCSPWRYIRGYGSNGASSIVSAERNGVIVIISVVLLDII